MSDLLDMYTTQTHVLPELLCVCVCQRMASAPRFPSPYAEKQHWKSWKDCSHEPLLRVRCSAVCAFPVQFWEWKTGRTAIKSKLLAPSLAACQWQTCWGDSLTASHSRTFHPSRHGSDLLDRPIIPQMTFTQSKGFRAGISRKQTCSPGHQTGSEYDRAKLLRQCHEWTRDSFEILSGCCAEASYLQIEIYVYIYIYIYICCRLLLAVVYR